MKEYKLYRTLHDIMHPSISRKNITNYKIVINENLLPLQIYYPNKEVILENIIIYIANKIDNYDIYNELAKRTNNLVILIDNNEKNKIDDYYKTINYIYDNTSIMDINPSNITIMSDFEGTDIENKIVLKSSKSKDFTINKIILLGPKDINVKNDKNNKLIIENTERKKDNYIGICLEKFIKGNDLATKEKVFYLINEFLN